MSSIETAKDADLKLTKLCAKAAKIRLAKGVMVNPSWDGETWIEWLETADGREDYWPLKNDAQAMALVKKLELWIQPPRQGHLSGAPSDKWFVAHSSRGGDSKNADLNRAIVECVAKLQGVSVIEGVEK